MTSRTIYFNESSSTAITVELSEPLGSAALHTVRVGPYEYLYLT
jgi:hypothetical protein